MVSGVFVNITREKLEQFIKKNGGRLQSGVSAKTDYLIVGKILDDNREVTAGAKYQKAISFGKKIMTEKEFELFCRQRFRNPDFLLGRQRTKDPTEESFNYYANAEKDKGDELEGVDDISEILAKRDAKAIEKPKKTSIAACNPESSDSTNSTKLHSAGSLFGSKFAQSPKKVPTPQPIASPKPASSALSNFNSQLWVDKYAPSCQNDLAGNRTVIDNFEKWLRDWNDVILKGMKKPLPAAKGRGDIPKINARTCLISGPPGIGKSSTARIIAKKLGFHIMELNASDTRSKNRIEELLKDFSKSGSIACKFNQQMGVQTEAKTVIIMDEVDGCSSSDRGGLGALVQIVKLTKVPIVCIANDRGNRKLQTLLNHSYDLRFQKPPSREVVRRVQMIARNENLQVDPQAIERLGEANGNDLRQTINILQLWSTTNKSLNCGQVSRRLYSCQKDQA